MLNLFFPVKLIRYRFRCCKNFHLISLLTKLKYIKLDLIDFHTYMTLSFICYQSLIGACICYSPCDLWTNCKRKRCNFKNNKKWRETGGPPSLLSAPSSSVPPPPCPPPSWRRIRCRCHRRGRGNRGRRCRCGGGWQSRRSRRSDAASRRGSPGKRRRERQLKLVLQAISLLIDVRWVEEFIVSDFILESRPPTLSISLLEPHHGS